MKDANQPTNMETLCGGTNLQVQLLGGKTETVFVRQVKMRELTRYSAMFFAQDEGAQVELFTGKSAEWVDALLPASFVAVLKEGQRLNVDFFAAWAERQKETAAMLETAMKSKSPNSPPNSPAKAG